MQAEESAGAVSWTAIGSFGSWHGMRILRVSGMRILRVSVVHAL